MRGLLDGGGGVTTERIESFRWTIVNHSKNRHLWLGHGTACGITKWHDIREADDQKACRACWAYAQGWLDRHDHGPNPPLDCSPLGYRSYRDRQVARLMTWTHDLPPEPPTPDVADRLWGYRRPRRISG